MGRVEEIPLLPCVGRKRPVNPRVRKKKLRLVIYLSKRALFRNNSTHVIKSPSLLLHRPPRAQMLDCGDLQAQVVTLLRAADGLDLLVLANDRGLYW